MGLSLPKPGRDSAEVAASVHMVGDSFLNNLSSDNAVRAGLANKLRTITKDGVGGSTLAEQAARFALTPRYYGHILLIVDGGLSDATLEIAQAAIQDMVGRLSHSRWLYMQGGLDSATRAEGMPNRILMNDLNDWVLNEYGAAHYVETKTAMQALSTGSANDLADLAVDAWPRSCTASGLATDVHPAQANDPIFFGRANAKVLENVW